MSEINIAIIIAILVIVIVLLIVVIMLVNNKGNSPQVQKQREYASVKMPSCIGLFLPAPIEKIGKREMHDVSRKVFDSYKYFDYQKMSVEELEKKEWHSWQVSLLIRHFQHDEEFFIPNQESIFHPFLLKSTENDMKSLMGGILRKYKNNVDISFTKDKLCKDYIWSNKEISIIFYFLANYKNYSK